MFALRKYKTISILIQLLICLNNLNGISSDDLAEGDTCTNGSKLGTCTTLQDCKSLNDKVQNKEINARDLPICSIYSFNHIIVCCTDVQPTDTDCEPVDAKQRAGSGGIVFKINRCPKVLGNNNHKLDKPINKNLVENITIPKNIEFIDLTELLSNNQLDLTQPPLSSSPSPPPIPPTRSPKTLIIGNNNLKIGKNKQLKNSKSNSASIICTKSVQNDQRNTLNFDLSNNSFTQYRLNNTNESRNKVECRNVESSNEEGELSNEINSFKFPTSTMRTLRDVAKDNPNIDINSVIDNIFKIPISTTTSTTTISPLSAITDYPIRNFSTKQKRQMSTSSTTVKSTVLDDWMISALGQASSTTPTTTTTSTTPRSNVVDFIDLSRKRTTTTTTTAPITFPNNLGNPNGNVQTVWVVQDSTTNGQRRPINNQQQPNWNNGAFQTPIQNQQHQPNWNRPQTFGNDPVKVIVIEEEEEPNWNQRGRNDPNQNFFNNNNFHSSQQPIQTQHHTWNGNGFNQGRPVAQNPNTEFVRFPNSQSTGSINSNQFSGSSSGSAINPDNPFLKPILNSGQQRSAPLIQYPTTQSSFRVHRF